MPNGLTDASGVSQARRIRWPGATHATVSRGGCITGWWAAGVMAMMAIATCLRPEERWRQVAKRVKAQRLPTNYAAVVYDFLGPPAQVKSLRASDDKARDT
jgi:hypothetical protein